MNKTKPTVDRTLLLLDMGKYLSLHQYDVVCSCSHDADIILVIVS